MPERRWADFLVAVAAWGSALLVTGAFVAVVGDVIVHGASGLTLSFLIDPLSDAGRQGGIGPVLVSTALLLAVCLIVALPMGIGTAILIAEPGSGGAGIRRWLRASLEVLAAVPSIVFGLFGNVFFARVLGLGFSILSGGLTLACMVLPIVIRSAAAGFSSVPVEVTRGAAALGMSRTTTVFQVMLPLALPGIMVGVILGIGRAAAETAALIFTSGYVSRMPGSLMDSGRSLSVHIYDLAMNVPGGEGNAYAAALVLVGLLLVVNQSAAWLADRFLGRQGVRA